MSSMVRSLESTPTSSSSVATITGLGPMYLEFTDVRNTTVCGSSVISWKYVGDNSYTMYLEVTGALSSDELALLLHTWSGNLTELNTFEWTVALPAGAYEAVIFFDKVTQFFLSQTFYVADSADHTCLGGSSGSSAASIGSSSTASTSSTFSTSSGNTTHVAPVEGSTHSKLPRGAIAGVVVGITAFFGLLSGIFFLLHRYRSRRDASGVFFKRRHSDTTTNSAVDITSLAVMEALEENAVSITGGAAASPEPVAVDHFPLQRDVHAHRNLYHDTQPSSSKCPSPKSSRSAQSIYFVPSDPFSDPLPHTK